MPVLNIQSPLRPPQLLSRRPDLRDYASRTPVPLDLDFWGSNNFKFLGWTELVWAARQKSKRLAKATRKATTADRFYWHQYFYGRSAVSKVDFRDPGNSLHKWKKNPKNAETQSSLDGFWIPIARWNALMLYFLECPIVFEIIVKKWKFSISNILKCIFDHILMIFTKIINIFHWKSYW